MEHGTNHTSLKRRVAWIERSAKLLAVAVIATGCAIEPKHLEQRELAQLAASDRETMFALSPRPDHPIGVDEAIARALKYNLDRRVKLMEEALAFDQTAVDRFDILPKAVVNSAYLSRSNPGASSSTDYITGQPSLANPSYSQDLRRVTRDLSLSWNILDLGVSWYNAQQNANRVLIARERRRKAVLSIIADVRSSYWRAMGAQVMQQRLRATIKEGETALRDTRQADAERLRPPLELLRLQKTILENVRQLRIVEQELATARAELAALMNLPPTQSFRLAQERASGLSMRIAHWNVPIERLEDVAFMRNPDVLDSVYQARVAVDDTRKALVKMLPGVSLEFSPKYDSNSFLVAQSWHEASIRLGGNLVANILAAPAQMAYAESNQRVVAARRLALRMALLAQVHVATQQIRSTRELFKNARELFEVDRRIADTVAVRQANDAQSAAESVANQTVALTSEMRVFSTYAQLQAALGRLHATLGLHIASDDEIAELDLGALKGILRERLAAIDAGRIH